MVVVMTKLASIEFEFEYDDELTDDEIREQFFDDLFDEVTGPGSGDIQPLISEKRPDTAIPNDTIVAICHVPIVMPKSSIVKDLLGASFSSLDDETAEEIGNKQVRELMFDDLKMVAEHLFYEQFWNSKEGVEVETVELEFSR